ncbi:MAG: hypothetical protein JSV50_21575 [Desulfobacteraceae bacterium]|nr:MAG: hypothetical protein JSV50_21575 [Desulfobacteraceae bacterium]
MKTEESQSPIASGKQRSAQEFIRQRLTRFGLSMIVMGICFPLYYLGLFGTMEGPLNPANLGARLGGIGVSRFHLLGFFLCLMIIALTWNWIYNVLSLLIGLRFTCSKTNDNGIPCGAPVTRKKIVHKKSGIVAPKYICTHGHKRPEAHFHPVKKSTFSHTLWVISLLFCIIIFYLS